MLADQVPKTDDVIQTPEDLDRTIGNLEKILLRPAISPSLKWGSFLVPTLLECKSYCVFLLFKTTGSLHFLILFYFLNLELFQ